MKKIISHAGRHPFVFSILLSMIVGGLISALIMIANMLSGRFFLLEAINSILWGGLFLGVFLIFPFVLISGEIIILICGIWKPELYERGRCFDLAGIFWGWILTYAMMEIGMNVVFKDWPETLVNAQVHTPLHTQRAWVFGFLLLLGVIGWCVMNFCKVKKTPPLTFVLGLAMMYLATAVTLVWGIQVFHPYNPASYFLELVPLHYLIMTARTVLEKMSEWKKEELSNRVYSKFDWLQKVNEWLSAADSWPWVAFLVMWPLLGIFMGVLVLFGQEPDAVIKMFTETSNWNLSQRVSPQNVMQDEHYLCTVAAGGHEKIVKPKRLGVRHGHQVIVNRQLCIANAFEQILEEKTPRFHKAVRHFYDTYGFPVAKMIHSKTAADIVYFVMKPLEWLFLIVLYLTDVNPENRIAIQYTGKNLKDF